jgi:HTH-type transcriptional regulator / antitoxin HipB
MNNPIHLKDIVKFHRKKAKLTQAELASLAGIGKTCVFDIEKGKPSVQLSSVIKVLSVLNITIEFKSPLMPAFMEQTHEKS